MSMTIEEQKIKFDKKIAFCYGLVTGLFIGGMICLKLT